MIVLGKTRNLTEESIGLLRLGPKLDIFEDLVVSVIFLASFDSPLTFLPHTPH